MSNICIIVNNYPNVVSKNKLVFVQQLVRAWADSGIKCTVICPMATNLHPEYKALPFKTFDSTKKGNKIDVYFPKYFGFGQKRKILGIRLARLTTYSFSRSVEKTIKKNGLQFDVFYGHFLLPSGIAAARMGAIFGKKSFFAYGESSANNTIEEGGRSFCVKNLRGLTGVVAVSSEGKRNLIENGIALESTIGVFPNGFDETVFYKMDKKKAREKMGLPMNAYIVGFVGSFDDRKGIKRLEDSIDSLKDQSIKLIACGSGKMEPSTSSCVFSGEVAHDNLVYFYNSMDVFCLPTYSEGCCNAIVESLACGVPVLSSNLPFNFDILKPSYSIVFDPHDVGQIADAIYRSKTVVFDIRDELEFASKLKIDERAKRILQFMEA